MMNKFFTAVAFIVVALSVSAQKKDPSNIDVSDLNYFKYKHRMMPVEPQDPLFFNYGVVVSELAPTTATIYNKETIEDRLLIMGQNKIKNFTERDYVLSAQIGNLLIKGNQTVNVGSTESPKYLVRITFSFSSHATLTKDGEVLFDENVYSPDDKNTYETETFGTPAEASKFWVNNTDVIKSDILQIVMDTTFHNFNRALSRRYGFYIHEESEEIKSMVTKRHSEYEVLSKNVNSLKTKFKKLDGTKPLTEADFADEIAYFKGLTERYANPDPKAKADSKLRFIGYYDLCIIYLLMDKPLEVITWADKLIANDQFPKRGEKFKKEADELIALFSDSFFKVRQFDTAPYLEQLQQSAE